MIRTISKWVLIGTILLLVLCLCGCAKQPDPVDTAANVAHQQIIALKETLPKECQTAAINEQLKAQDETIDTIVANCHLQKQKIIAEKNKWQWAFGALSLLVLVYFGRKVLKMGL